MDFCIILQFLLRKSSSAIYFATEPSPPQTLQAADSTLEIDLDEHYSRAHTTAAGAQITQSRLGEVVTRNNGPGLSGSGIAMSRIYTP